MNQARHDSIPTRHSLLNRLKDWRDEASWREFFELYWELIYNVARKAGLNDGEAQEVVQETVIGVAKNIGGFETDARRGSFKAWLLQQTGWRIADRFRERVRAGRGPESPGNSERGRNVSDTSTGTATVNRIPDPASLDVGELWEAEWEQHVMRIALERVKEKVSVKQFQIFDLHALQGLSVWRTARTLGVSIASVYMAKSRVARLVRKEAERLARGKVD